MAIGSAETTFRSDWITYPCYSHVGLTNSIIGYVCWGRCPGFEKFCHTDEGRRDFTFLAVIRSTDRLFPRPSMPPDYFHHEMRNTGRPWIEFTPNQEVFTEGNRHTVPSTSKGIVLEISGTPRISVLPGL